MPEAREYLVFLGTYRSARRWCSDNRTPFSDIILIGNRSFDVVRNLRGRRGRFRVITSLDWQPETGARTELWELLSLLAVGRVVYEDADKGE